MLELYPDPDSTNKDGSVKNLPFSGLFGNPEDRKAAEKARYQDLSQIAGLKYGSKKNAKKPQGKKMVRGGKNDPVEAAGGPDLGVLLGGVGLALVAVLATQGGS